MTLLARAVSLPPAGLVGGGVLDQARPLPEGWTRGLTFATEACLAAGEHLFCPTSPGEKNFQGTTLAEFTPYGIEVSVVCTTLGGADSFAVREARADQALDAKAEISVGSELATGALTGNPSLADASSSGTGADAVAALAILEDEIAQTLGTFQAWIHATPARLTELVAGYVVYRDMGGWRSPGGHVVVASGGYVGNIDDELVATTEVFAEVGPIDRGRTVDREDNRYLSVHEAPALAVFDDCFNVSVAIETSP